MTPFLLAGLLVLTATLAHANTIIVRVGSRGDVTPYTQAHRCAQPGFPTIPYCKRWDQEAPPTPAGVKRIVAVHPMAYAIDPVLYMIVTVWHQGTVPHILWHGWWTPSPVGAYNRMQDWGLIPLLANGHGMQWGDDLFVDVQCWPPNGQPIGTPSTAQARCQAAVEYHLEAE